MAFDWDVVIIGGGAAGIGAARRLAESGHSTLLLEASQRMGGRALTVNVAGHALDLGCGWPRPTRECSCTSRTSVCVP